MTNPSLLFLAALLAAEKLQPPAPTQKHTDIAMKVAAERLLKESENKKP